VSVLGFLLFVYSAGNVNQYYVGLALLVFSLLCIRFAFGLWLRKLWGLDEPRAAQEKELKK